MLLLWFAEEKQSLNSVEGARSSSKIDIDYQRTNYGKTLGNSR